MRSILGCYIPCRIGQDMNNTYNRMLILVVNERLEEGKRLEAVKAGVTRVGGAIKRHWVNAGLAAAMVATAGYGMRNSAIRAAAADDKPAATAASEPSAEKPIVKPSAAKR